MVQKLLSDLLGSLAESDSRCATCLASRRRIYTFQKFTTDCEGHAVPIEVYYHNRSVGEGQTARSVKVGIGTFKSSKGRNGLIEPARLLYRL